MDPDIKALLDELIAFDGYRRQSSRIKALLQQYSDRTDATDVRVALCDLLRWLVRQPIMDRIEDLEVDNGYPWMVALRQIISNEPVFSQFFELKIYDKSMRYTPDGIQFRKDVSLAQQQEIKQYARENAIPPKVMT